MRKLREEAQQVRHKHEGEVELIKQQNKNDLETIQEKVSAAMGKKKEVIE